MNPSSTAIRASSRMLLARAVPGCSTNRPRRALGALSVNRAIQQKQSARRNFCVAAASETEVQISAWAEQRAPIARKAPLFMSFDLTEDAHDALLWTMRNMCRDGDRLVLVHVLCDPAMLRTTIATGASPSGLVSVVDSIEDASMSTMHAAIEYHTMHLNDKAKESLEVRCQDAKERGIDYELLLPVILEPRSAAAIAHSLLAEAQEAGGRLLVLASHGPGAIADFGSVVRYCFQHSRLPLLLLPRDIDTAPPPPGQSSDVVLLVNSQQELIHNYSWVAENLCLPGDCLQVWYTSREEVEVPQEVVQGLAERGVGLSFFCSVANTLQEPEEWRDKVCSMLHSPHIKAVSLVNYCRVRSMVRESLEGSLSSHLSRHCSKPLLLLQPAATS